MYPQIESPDAHATLKPAFLAECTLLTSLNRNVDVLNKITTDMLQGERITYNATDTLDEESQASTDFSPEFLNSLNPNGIPPYALELKKGLPIILLQNLNSAKGLCNGTCLIICKLGPRLIQARIITGVCAGKLAWILCIPLTNSDKNKSCPISFERLQFPI